MWNRIKDWWQAEGDLRTARGMSERALADMGLSREGLRGRVIPRRRSRTNESAPGPLPGAVLRALLTIGFSRS